MPEHILNLEDNKTSFSIEFKNLNDRDKAKELLSDNNIRFRAGKTLFRSALQATSNGAFQLLYWMAKMADTWVWPESLWAPISLDKDIFKTAGKNPKMNGEKYWKKHGF